mmetsp:Transcript_33015/g.66229  ORF Transcript_33015/g.66229 Transcript_33015/m.66229 type:complete len:101 (+) Transcript_33015:123-425(+)
MGSAEKAAGWSGPLLLPALPQASGWEEAVLRLVQPSVPLSFRVPGPAKLLEQAMEQPEEAHWPLRPEQGPGLRGLEGPEKEAQSLVQVQVLELELEWELA